MIIYQCLGALPLLIGALRLTFVVVLNQKSLCGLCAEGADFPRPRYAQAAKLQVAVCVYIFLPMHGVSSADSAVSRPLQTLQTATAVAVASVN